MPSTDTDANLRGSPLLADPEWFSADVDEVVKDLSILFMQNSTRRGKPFY
eukprot:SAG31_NODE_46407_length_254_cov_1.329032_1_plen_49_part_01